jgi:hypothetical protein
LIFASGSLYYTCFVDTEVSLKQLTLSSLQESTLISDETAQVPSAVVYNEDDSKLYVAFSTEQGGNKISRMELDGSSMETICEEGASNGIISLVVTSGEHVKIFWIHQSSGMIYSYDTDTQQYSDGVSGWMFTNASQLMYYDNLLWASGEYPLNDTIDVASIVSINLTDYSENVLQRAEGNYVFGAFAIYHSIYYFVQDKTNLTASGIRKLKGNDIQSYTNRF